MDWELHAARWRLGRLPIEELTILATEALVEGSNSHPLALLAGRNQPAPWEDGPLFEQALAELGVAIPDLRDAVMPVARQIARQIVEGRLDPCVGAKQMCELARDIDGESELNVFIGPESEISDFQEQVQIDYYGPEYCARVREDNLKKVVAAAKALLAGA